MKRWELNYLLIAAALLVSCQDTGSLTGPTAPVEHGTVSSTEATEPVAVTGGIESCGLKVKPAGIEWEMSDTTVRAFIPIEYTGEGRLIVKLWDGEVNDGTVYGPFPANEWFSFVVPQGKPYRFRIAGELDLDGDGLADNGCQDDRFYLDVEPPAPSPTPPPVPPPPPPPPEEPPPQCEAPIPDEGVYSLTIGTAQAECWQLNHDGVQKDESAPWNLQDGDIYLLKCGTQYEVRHDKPGSSETECSLPTAPGPGVHDISHVTVCRSVCEDGGTR